MHLKGTSMGNKFILIALITLIATAGFLLIKSDTPITIAGETLGAEPTPVRGGELAKEEVKSSKSSKDTKSTENQK
jgi:hypothetical protein